MDNNRDTITIAVLLILKAAVVAARYSGRVRKRSLKRLAAMNIDEKDKEILFLIDKVYQLDTQVSILLKRVEKHQKKPRYTIRERLLILWHMETFQIPRRKVAERLGVSKSTVYRWLHKIQDDDKQARIPANKTPTEIAALVWEIAKSNISCGRVRISNQLGLLNVFISASTVRNILKQPEPDNPRAPTTLKNDNNETAEPKSIPAWYPNHVWSIDTTEVMCWGLWPIHVCVVIDHFSRKVMSVTPLEGPNAGWINNALETAIERHGAPKHIVSDQARVFIGKVYAKLLERWTIKPRLGAIGKHGSISVTERVNKTFKYEWLKRVSLIKGFDHLVKLCDEFEDWYNAWRPHMTLDGLRPDDIYYDRKLEKPDRNAKTIPENIERHLFHETRVTGYRLKHVA